MNIVLLGAGNVATVLAKMATARGHHVLQIFSRNPINAAELAEAVSAEPVTDLKNIRTDADLYVAALTDTAVASLHQHLNLSRGVLVHTAGALNMEVLEPAAPNYGVLYPIQSLRKEKSDYSPFPWLTQASTPETLAFITDFAETLSPTVKPSSNAERLHLHLAAVVANNFTNHLYALTQQFCKQHQVSFDLLKPLIVETALRIDEFDPYAVQTGPALRHDADTISKHLELLRQNPQLEQLYHALSNSIAKMHEPRGK
ncbi:MAG: DUF2520 domain-containing protein [Bacteroidetes bacterium]|nr:MAG: DUF2520 domain-containing protein [Bacteroidota bacterium]